MRAVQPLRFAVLLALAASGAARAQTDAQSAAALSSMATLAGAEELCAAETTYYVSLETLNDISGSSTAQTPYDGINYEGGTWVIRPIRGQFNASRVNLVTAYNAWGGPYVTYQSGATQTASAPYDLGSPLDPWGNPYYFFSPLGLLRGDEGAVTLELYGDSFDRYAIVSLGPDGVESSDDLIYTFGSGVSTFAISSVRAADGSKSILRMAASGAPAARKAATRGAMPAGATLSGGLFQAAGGAAIVIRGAGFGDTQSGGQALWGATPLTNISSWSAREIALTLPANLTGTATLTVARGGSTSLPATLSIVAPPNAAAGWTLYQ